MCNYKTHVRVCSGCGTEDTVLISEQLCPGAERVNGGSGALGSCATGVQSQDRRDYGRRGKDGGRSRYACQLCRGGGGSGSSSSSSSVSSRSASISSNWTAIPGSMPTPRRGSEASVSSVSSVGSTFSSSSSSSYSPASPASISGGSGGPNNAYPSVRVVGGGGHYYSEDVQFSAGLVVEPHYYKGISSSTKSSSAALVNRGNIGRSYGVLVETPSFSVASSQRSIYGEIVGHGESDVSSPTDSVGSCDSSISYSQSSVRRSGALRKKGGGGRRGSK